MQDAKPLLLETVDKDAVTGLIVETVSLERMVAWLLGSVSYLGFHYSHIFMDHLPCE